MKTNQDCAGHPAAVCRLPLAAGCAAMLACFAAGCATAPPAPGPEPAQPAEETCATPPRVIVLLTEKDAGGAPAAEVESAAVRYLMARNIPVVDRTVVQQNKEKIQSLLTLAGDDQGAAAIGMQFGADVVIRGEAEARLTAAGIRGSKLNSYQGVLALRAIYADDGQILATASAAAPVIAMDAVSGSARALQAAADQALPKLFPELIKGWRGKTAGAGKGQDGSGMSLSAVFRNAEADPAELDFPKPPRGHQPPVSAIWRLSPQVGVQAEWMEPLTETLYAVFAQSGWYRLVTREDMEKIMTEHNIQLSDICDTTERAIELGKIMSAQKMLIGGVSKLGGTYQVVLKLVDVETGEIESVGRSESKGTMDVLFSLVRLAGRDLLMQSAKR